MFMYFASASWCCGNVASCISPASGGTLPCVCCRPPSAAHDGATHSALYLPVGMGSGAAAPAGGLGLGTGHSWGVSVQVFRSPG